jgi:hypothetical protein
VYVNVKLPLERMMPAALSVVFHVAVAGGDALAITELQQVPPCWPNSRHPHALAGEHTAKATAQSKSCTQGADDAQKTCLN